MDCAEPPPLRTRSRSCSHSYSGPHANVPIGYLVDVAAFSGKLWPRPSPPTYLGAPSWLSQDLSYCSGLLGNPLRLSPLGAVL